MEMDCCRFGNGDRTLVILPGLSVLGVTGLAEAIEKQYQKLTKLYKIYVFDRRTNVPENYSLQQMADDTVLAMRAEGLMVVDLFGVSQGGMIALCIAQRYPEKVKRLILGSTSGVVTKKLKKSIETWIKLAKKEDHRGLQEAFVDPMYGKQTLKKYRDALLASTPEYTPKQLERFIRLAKACLNFDLTKNLDLLKTKPLLIGSEGDEIIGGEGVKQLHELIPSELTMYPEEYGHAVYDEAPDYVDRMIKFLE